ncbi:hypothetical protein SDC9_71675 [bioreactor metagenome]|uniref:SDR family oxidoreductase n=1 Tax=bioreactor metagenome TaxID=1076179 RepID=A0A644Y9F2_9ZZZZ
MDQNSVVIITGASSGIGKATAAALAERQAHIVMLCKDSERGMAALKDVKRSSCNQNVILMLCDLGSRKSIELFCAAFRSRFSRLDVLINNAGVALFARQETTDGFEMHFGVNYLGSFILTNLLLDLLIDSAPSRIINVSSNTHANGTIHFDDINLKKKFRPWRAYEQSKLAEILFTYTLAERLRGTGVTANCLHPGAVGTQIGVVRNKNAIKAIRKIVSPFFLTAEKGAETAVYLAVSPNVTNTTGAYFVRKRARRSSKLSYNRVIAERLWSLSEKMTGICGYRAAPDQVCCKRSHGILPDEPL